MIQVRLKYKNVCYYLIGITWPVLREGSWKEEEGEG